MVSANLNIIAELKYVLELVKQSADYRKSVTFHPNDFIRDRKLPIERVIGLILNMPKRSLSIEVRAFFECLDNTVSMPTKAAFCMQRTKLNPLFFQLWNKILVGSFYHHYANKVKRWRGFRLIAADGSTGYLINKPDLKEYFGTQGNGRTDVAMTQIMQLQDILNDLTIWGDIFPIKKSESAIIAAEIDQLPEDSITLLDRGYPSYSLMYLLTNQETPRHFVIRCKASFNKETRAFIKSSKRSKIIMLTPDKDAIKTMRGYGVIVTANTAIKVRMARIKLSTGEEEILFTNLYCPCLYTIADLYYLYGLRWGIETTFNKQKNQQQMEQFSGHRVICIQQDCASTIFIANIQSLIEKQCDCFLKQINKRRKYDYKINKNISWALLKDNIIKLFLCNNEQEILLKLTEEFKRYIEPVRKGRKFKREIKFKKIKGKYQTFTNYKRAI
jgi:hypothetical protein